MSLLGEIVVGLVSRLLAPILRREPRWDASACFAEHPSQPGLLCTAKRGHQGPHAAKILWQNDYSDG